jgi:DNA replication protein DnaC
MLVAFTLGSPADRILATLLARLARLDLLVVDDWATAPLADTERRDFLEFRGDRYQIRSMILTSQLPVAKWHGQIGRTGTQASHRPREESSSTPEQARMNSQRPIPCLRCSPLFY